MLFAKTVARSRMFILMLNSFRNEQSQLLNNFLITKNEAYLIMNKIIFTCSGGAYKSVPAFPLNSTGSLMFPIKQRTQNV